jgi:small nuclear ribonucleoprotein (snRNP)-like protein
MIESREDPRDGESTASAAVHLSPAPLISGRCLGRGFDGLANSVHDLRVARGLRGQYVRPDALRGGTCLNADASPLQPSSALSRCPPHLPPPPTCAGKMLVMLRDGRKLVGVLRSYDQFGMTPVSSVCRRALSIVRVHAANLVLEDTVERIYHRDVFAENWRGLYLIRGENVVLLGEIVSTRAGA